ncbi:MAG TPA: CLI_3235 family bacteriocin precursor [Acetivibrio sp.]|uniref:CLI_3235 family bacteriocin precursor n=1 Tax=Acetivibrio sp. TaxID=1872092 RepID=UPI002C9AC745|nr:CLI_3235 family bacteriocin precursor [Acetivibrio sp.]HOM03452.1 CLI_3235 family bacteriocin precursor [Acetivibrio sp.]
MKKLGKNMNAVKETVEAYASIGICTCGCGCACGVIATANYNVTNGTKSATKSSFGYKG